MFMTDVCRQPKETGPCSADFLRYYWSEEDSECRPFTYGGCQGNGNNFATQEECYSTCNAALQPTGRRYSPGDCYEPVESGTCGDSLSKWYFDSVLGDCLAFHYSGCSGNGNNFLGYEDCVAFCNRGNRMWPYMITPALTIKNMPTSRTNLCVPYRMKLWHACYVKEHTK